MRGGGETAGSRGFAWGLVAIVLLGAALRLAGITHGLDFEDPRLSIWNNQNDEETQALAVRDRHLAGNFDPGACWMWGSGGFQTYGVLDRALLPLLGRVVGADASAEGLASNLSLVLLSHRIAATCAALLAIVLLARLARREFGASVGLAAAFFLAVAYLPIRESHYGTLDQWLVLGAVIALDRAFVLSRVPSWKGVVVAGAFAGAFASFKYSGAALFAPLVIGAWRGLGGGFSPRTIVALASRTFAALAAGAVAYLAFSPTLFRSFQAARDGFRSQRGLIGFEWGRVLEMAGYHANSALWLGAGETLALAAIVGVLVLATRARPAAGESLRGSAILLLCLLPAFAIFPLSNTSHSVRQSLPLFPWIALVGAIGVTAVARGNRRRVAAIALIVALPSLVRGTTFDALVGRKDTRVEAMRLLRDSGATPQQAIGVGFYGLPRTSGIAVRSPFLDWLDAVHRRRQFARTQASTLKPRFLIRDLCAGVDDSLGWVDFAAIAERDYREVLRIDGRRDGVTPALPDQVHGTPFHFVPYEQPWTMVRPGPAYVVYERVATD